MPTLSPARTICLGFLLLIAIGTLLLLLPWSTASGEWTPWLVALFTSTSAVCVTGLVVVDTGSYYSFFGQLVILLLIQVGGLGYMSATTFLLLLVGRRISLRNRLALQEALGSLGDKAVPRLVARVAILTLSFELVGALVIAPTMVRQEGLLPGLWSAIFHSVSAFNNAGFGLRSDNLIPWQNNFWVLGGLGFLILAGGLGYQVWIELYEKILLRLVRLVFGKQPAPPAPLSLHTRVVLLTSAILVVVGSVCFFLIERTNALTLGRLSLDAQVAGAIFHSISARTAGFNAVPFDGLLEAGLFWMILLMLIGASPASTGGGLKTTTFAILTSNMLAVIQGREDVLLFDRRLGVGAVRKASAVLLGSIAAIAVALVGLTLSDPEPGFVQVLFEAVSAFCTVGLSTGITPKLSVVGQLILVFSMYLGRVGVLLLAEALLSQKPTFPYRQPEEQILIG
ncbi:MAG: ATPase [Aphanocapsa lilacina HA4352-LM1]|jgi:trk system potassium uptake protein TrkH|nr:ATPase [Aphanocapsa lilacina HA4352-LM1]